MRKRFKSSTLIVARLWFWNFFGSKLQAQLNIVNNFQNTNNFHSNFEKVSTKKTCSRNQTELVSPLWQTRTNVTFIFSREEPRKTVKMHAYNVFCWFSNPWHWVNGNAMFYETFIWKKITNRFLGRFLLICVTNKLNVSHSTSFNIIQQLRTMIQTKTLCFIEVETNRCLMQHCVVV